MSLKCQRNDCIYNNKEGNCFAKQIAIGRRGAKSTKETICESYVPSGDLYMSEFANEFTLAGRKPSDTRNIKCEARNCRFNVNRDCMAPSVEINHEDASCETFEP